MTPETLVERIKTTGYGASLPGRHAERRRAPGRAGSCAPRGVSRLPTKGIASLVIGVAVMIVPMSVAMTTPMWPWIQLVMTTAVMLWAGRTFYSRAWTAFRHRSADMNTLIAVGTGSAYLYSLAATIDPALFTSTWCRAEFVLRGGDHHHRAHSRWECARGAREGRDRGSDPAPHRLAAEDRACAAQSQELDIPVADS